MRARGLVGVGIWAIGLCAGTPRTAMAQTATAPNMYEVATMLRGDLSVARSSGRIKRSKIKKETVSRQSVDSDGNPGSAVLVSETNYNLDGDQTDHTVYGRGGQALLGMQHERDGKKRITKTKNPHASKKDDVSSVDFVYDDAGRLQKSVVNKRKNGTDEAEEIELDYAYDASGRLTARTAVRADGGVVRRAELEYLPDGRQSATREYGEDGELAAETQFTYTEEGGSATAKVYDAGHGVLSRSESNYDSAGNLTGTKSHNAAGEVVSEASYTYGEITYADDPAAVWTYAKAGSGEYTEVSAAAADDVAADVAFCQKADDCLYLGSATRRFCGLRANLSTPASSNFSFVIEYWNGAWTAITPEVDTTSGFTNAEGHLLWKVSKLPDWQQSSPAAGMPSAYYVRVRRSGACTTPPVATTILPAEKKMTESLVQVPAGHVQDRTTISYDGSGNPLEKNRYEQDKLVEVVRHGYERY